MTTPTALHPAPPPSDPAPFSVAGAFLDGLAAQDFSRIAATLDDAAHLCALLPCGMAEWDGPDQIIGAFRHWFGEVDRFDLVDAGIGEVGPRLLLRWRIRVQAEERGQGWLVIEQQMHADAASDGRLTRLSLLCSGFQPATSPRTGASTSAAQPSRWSSR